MKFSERIGVIERVVQKDSMDEGLRNALWNAAYRRYWARYANNRNQVLRYVAEGELLSALWTEHFDKKFDELPLLFPDALSGIRRLFDSSKWPGVYDFVEFIATSPVSGSDQFIADCNRALEKHVSAYRFVGNKLAAITSAVEIEAVEAAASSSGTVAPVARHVETALRLFADRDNPDYRNSIKESISAVEAACQIVTSHASASLGTALKALKLHPALEKGFSAIYGYTSDAEGIRHALSEEPTIGSDDARLFLVLCSGFANYLIARSATAAPGAVANGGTSASDELRIQRS
jgi:hypothetical protein